MNPIFDTLLTDGLLKKFLQTDYSATSDQVYTGLIDLRSTGIFNVTLTQEQAPEISFVKLITKYFLEKPTTDS